MRKISECVTRLVKKTHVGQYNVPKNNERGTVKSRWIQSDKEQQSRREAIWRNEVSVRAVILRDRKWLLCHGCGEGRRVREQLGKEVHCRKTQPTKQNTDNALSTRTPSCYYTVHKSPHISLMTLPRCLLHSTRYL